MTKQQFLQEHIDWLEKRLSMDRPADLDIREDLIGLLADYKNKLAELQQPCNP